MAASVHASTAQHRNSSSSANFANKKRLSQPNLTRRTTDPKSAHKAKRKSGDFAKGFSLADHDDDNDDESMPGGFSQFCATCETQIVVPSSSILYCSERCRRKDCGMSPPASPPLNTSSTRASKRDDDVDIIPPLSPTVRSQPAFFGSYPQEDAVTHGRTAPKPQTRIRYNRSESDAARYLGQFHGDMSRSVRPRSSRQSTVPSLSHTPSSSSSSSVPFIMVSDMERPLPSSRSLVSKSVDLVTPAAAASETPDSLETLTARAASLQLSDMRNGFMSDGEEDGPYENLSYDDTPGTYYEKRGFGEQRESSAQSSLKQLLQSGRDKG